PGWEIGLKEVGYLFVLNSPEDVDAFAESVALQRSQGLGTQIVSAEEVRRLCPLVEGDDILAGAFSPRDGHCTPEGVVQGYAHGARTLGAAVIVGCEVIGIDVRDSEIVRVRTDRGSIRTGVVICAAGAWSRKAGAMAGIDLPVTPLRRQILHTE